MVSSRIYKQAFLKVKRRPGRKLSPVITDGLIKPGRSAYNVVPITPCNKMQLSEGQSHATMCIDLR